jgi:hypothetical protein
MEAYCRPLTELCKSVDLEQPTMLSENDFDTLLNTYFKDMSIENKDQIFHFFAHMSVDADNKSEIKMNFNHLEHWVLLSCHFSTKIFMCICSMSVSVFVLYINNAPPPLEL